MARFGSTATFYYHTGDTLTLPGGTYLYLTPANMPNYPFETEEDSDRQIHRTKTGRKYTYQNYNLAKYGFNFSNLSEGVRGSLKQMFDARPVFSFVTNENLWGTFRFDDNSWRDSEVAYSLFDLSFTMVEDA